MEFKGTHGAWAAELGYNRETTIKCGEIRIAEVKHYNDGSDDWSRNDPFKEEGQANAKLIACAPELLQMVKDLLMNRNHMNEDQIWLAKQLIKKATE